MNVTVDDPVFEELIDPSAELMKIGEGYQFSEGPVWNQREQALYFSDIPGDARWRRHRGTPLPGRLRRISVAASRGAAPRWSLLK